MTEAQMKFLELINKVMPQMTEMEQEKLLAFGDGLAFMAMKRESSKGVVERSA